MKIPIILDSDAGTDIDDLYALAVALRHPEIDLKGITTVYGDTQARARLVAKMVRLAGRFEIPVAAGIRVPLARLARGELDLNFTDFLNHTQFVTPEDVEFEQVFPEAVPLILKILQQSPQPLGLIGIGAWSNLAQVLLSASVEQKAKIKFIALMGGEIERMQAEHNVACDPEAAEIVLNCGLPVFLGTYRITRQISFTFEEIEQLFRDSPDPLLQALLATTRLWRPHCGTKPGPILYDIVPVFWAVRPEMVTTQPMQVHIELSGQLTRGFTVATLATGHQAVFVATQLDASGFKKELVRLL